MISKGSITPKAEDLAGLHERKLITTGQHFTPEWISAGIWHALSEYTTQAKQDGVHLAAFDSSIGSGSLYDAMPTTGISLYGTDTDKACVEALVADVADAGIEHEIATASMADIEVDKYHLSLINPPFNLTLSSPNLWPYDCTTYGRYGSHTHAKSHEYALALSLDNARVVAAVLPTTMDEHCRSLPELRAAIRLPKSTFMEEGANVDCTVYLFEKNSASAEPIRISIAEGDQWPVLKPHMKMMPMHCKWRVNGVSLGARTIKTPVTGNNEVVMHHHNRRISLSYRCGLTQAKVINGLLQATAKKDPTESSKRFPSTISYVGDGQFLLDVLLLNDNPEVQLDLLADRIRQLGGAPVISQTLRGYYRKLVRKHQRAITPMYHTVKRRQQDRLSIVAKRRQLLEPGNYSSPSVAKGQVLEARLIEGEFELEFNGALVRLTRSQLTKRFEVDTQDLNSETQWTNIHKGLCSAFPELAKMWGRRLDKAGIDWLAAFQRASVIEGLISPYGYIAGWLQGTGKSRGMIAMGLAHESRTLIVVESGLLPEMLIELRQKLKIDESRYQVLTADSVPEKGLCITTYATLRSRFREKQGPAKRWRRMFHTILCDEGGVLCNIHTLQTRAIKSLNCRKLVVFDGTPMRNHVTDMLPLATVTAGNGMAHQKYGVKGKPYLEPRLKISGSYARRGEDVYSDRHVDLQWVTHEFSDELSTGGKRMVPRLLNPELFRSWVKPFIQRRLTTEPDLAGFGQCPTPVRNIEEVSWDEDHLAHYLTVACDFIDWYRKVKSDDSKKINMIAVLARIAAVQKAANSPHVESEKDNFKNYYPVTSKQKRTVELTLEHVKAGRKVIVYAKSPSVVNRLARLVREKDCDSVVFTGNEDINKRSREMDEKFRHGDTQVLLCSWVAQRGLNLEQAGAVIFYERSWSATTEEQAIARTQRPDQTQIVQVTYMHLAGSIDIYCDQMVRWKTKAAEDSLDYGEGADQEEQFLHLDSVLATMCEETLKMTTHEAKEYLAA